MAEAVVPSRRSHQLRKLTQISRSLTDAMSIEEVLKLSVDCAAELLHAERVVLLMRDDDDALRIRASRGLQTKACEQFAGPLRETLIIKLQLLLGVGDDNRFLGVPLVATGAVTGMLAVCCQSPLEDDSFDEEEWLLSALADQVAVALEKTRLDQTAAFRERLIGIVSHDLRNPIAAISMTAETLLRRDQLDDYTTRAVVRMQASSKRAQRMVCDLLDYTQAKLGGGITMKRAPVAMHQVMQDIVDEMHASHPDREIMLTQQGSDHIVCDADRVSQALGNVLRNALQYSAATSVVRVSSTSEAGMLTLRVHNDGEPIPVDRLPTLFEPMQRAVEQITQGERSVGLGLYIVRHIMQAHGGDVTVASNATGTTFTLQLPYVPI